MTEGRIASRVRGLAALSATLLGALTLVVVVLAYQHAIGGRERAVTEHYVEVGRRLLSEGDQQRALPFLVAARARGDESEGLKRLFHAATALTVREYAFPDAAEIASAVAYSPDGKKFAAASRAWVHIWDVETDARLSSLPITAQGEPAALPGWVHHLDFSADGDQIMASSGDTLLIWDVATGVRRPDETLADARSPVGSGLVGLPAGGAAGSLSLVREAPRALTARLAAPTRLPSHGGRIATSNGWRGARVWDAATTRPLTPWLHAGHDVTTAVLSPDGNQLLTAGRGAMAHRWDLSPDNRSLAEWQDVLRASPYPTIAAALTP
jgi:dipeptidyl aminopeptidase/acylaminoacyl peptidase